MAKNPLGGGREDDDDERVSRTTASSGSAQRTQSEPNPQAGTYLDAGREAEEDQRTSIQAMSDTEVEEFLRTEFLAQVLPNPPAIPGFHLCWLSTTNQYDTIAYRQRLGYVPVSPDDLPNFKSVTQKTGEFAGCIAVNEMLLFKISESRYRLIMKEFHHNRPAQEDEKLRANLEAMQNNDKGAPMIAEMGDGTEELLRSTRTRAPAQWD